MNGSERVKLSKVVEKMQLENMTPQIDISLRNMASYSGGQQTGIAVDRVL